MTAADRLLPCCFQTLLLLAATALVMSPAAADDDPVKVPAPSAAEVRATLESHIDALNAGAMRFLPDDGGAGLQVRLDGLVLHGCASVDDDPSAFDCRMDLRLQLPKHRPETRLVTMRFTRAIGEWVVN